RLDEDPVLRAFDARIKAAEGQDAQLGHGSHSWSARRAFSGPDLLHHLCVPAMRQLGKASERCTKMKKCSLGVGAATRVALRRTLLAISVGMVLLGCADLGSTDSPSTLDSISCSVISWQPDFSRSECVKRLNEARKGSAL